jgi:hypothetical protein
MFKKTLELMNQDIETISSLEEKIVDAGFQSCSVVKGKLPFSYTPNVSELKEISTYSPELHEIDTTVISERGLRPILNLSAIEVETVLAEALSDMRDKNIQAYRHG